MNKEDSDLLCLFLSYVVERQDPRGFTPGYIQQSLNLDARRSERIKDFIKKIKGQSEQRRNQRIQEEE